MKRLIITILFLSFSLPMHAMAQSGSNPEADVNVTTFTEGMTRHQGFYTFYHDTATGNYYLAVPRTAEPLLLQTSMPRGLGSNDIGLDRGQLGSTRVVEFVVSNHKVLLQEQNTKYKAVTDNQAERQSVTEAFASSVLWGFNVVAHDEQQVLIDYTPYLLSDTHGIAERLKRTDQGQYKVSTDRSMVYPPRSKAFVDNTELEATVTFVGTPEGRFVRQVAPDAQALTVHLRHSLVRLPDNGFEPREFHPNSGYWSMDYVDYAAPLGEPMRKQFIPRHRLQKAKPNAERSEAVEPIVYYLDPGAPEPVRTALLEGGRWWNQAFNAIGYEDAFQIKVLPEDADPMDVRYNVIQWVHRATRGWSYGSSVTDPRTGEIIKGHVTLGSLRVRQDMRIAQALLKPYAEAASAAERKNIEAQVEAMALARIRQLSAHEIGHTLGISHNFAASVHDRASVMDYPHPLLSLNTQDNGIGLSESYTNEIGLWDKQVIAYGYGDNKDTQSLETILRENRALGLTFISDRDARPAGGAHPEAHLWDNGSDAVTELERILDIREQVLANFDLDVLAPGEPVSRLQELFVPMYALHRYQIEAAVKMLGGVNYSYYVKGEDKLDYRPVNSRQQKLALTQMIRAIHPDTLTVPDKIQQLLVPLSYGDNNNRERFSGRMGLIPDVVSMAEAAASAGLTLLLQPERLNRLALQHQHNDGIPAPTAVLSELATQIIAPATADNGTVTAQRIAYVTLFHVAQTYQDKTLGAEVRAQLHGFLTQQQQRLTDAESGYAQFLADRLKVVLEEGHWPDDFTPVSLPPGSPI
ncbi:MAG: zinc-dependent metalloprotease [Idiomarina sp.]